MLIEFTVGNFRSFAEPVTLSMEATKLKAQDPEVDAKNTFDAGKNLKLLKVAAIYGANASGKSNLLKALKFMLDFVKNSNGGVHQYGGIPVEPYLLLEDLDKAPSTFEIQLLMPDGTPVVYGFAVTADRVEEEWLHSFPNGRKRELLDRQAERISVSRYFPEARRVAGLVRSNSLFLTLCAQTNGMFAQEIVRRLEQIIIVDMSDALSFAKAKVDFQSRISENDAAQINDLLHTLSLGFEEVSVESDDEAVMPKGGYPARVMERRARYGVSDGRIVTHHRRYSSEQVERGRMGHAIENSGTVWFDLETAESEGTRKLFVLAPFLLQVLRDGGCLLVDELDSSVHPFVVHEIVNLFQDQDANCLEAQLILTTHDTTLLDRTLLRRDQIWFVEKDNFGQSVLYSLSEFASTKARNDATYARDYLSGRFGGIPYTGAVSAVLGDS